MKSKVTVTSLIDTDDHVQMEFSCQMHNGNRGGWATDNLTLLNNTLDATVDMMNCKSTALPKDISPEKASRWVIAGLICPVTMPFVAGFKVVQSIIKMSTGPKTTAMHAFDDAIADLRLDDEQSKGGKLVEPAGHGLGGSGSSSTSSATVSSTSSATASAGLGGGHTMDDDPAETTSPRTKLREDLEDIAARVQSGMLKFKTAKRGKRYGSGKMRAVVAVENGVERALTEQEHYLMMATRLKVLQNHPMFSSDWRALEEAVEQSRNRLLGMDVHKDKEMHMHAGLGHDPGAEAPTM